MTNNDEVTILAPSDYMWEMCDRSKAISERDPSWFENLATDKLDKTVVIIYCRMAEIPEFERGDWFEQAVPFAMLYLNDGAHRWVDNLHRQLLNGEGSIIPYIREPLSSAIPGANRED